MVRHVLECPAQQKLSLLLLLALNVRYCAVLPSKTIKWVGSIQKYRQEWFCGVQFAAFFCLISEKTEKAALKCRCIFTSISSGDQKKCRIIARQNSL